jgi:S1-C subfamily serine protease
VDVSAGSPAGNAGLKAKDVIVGFAGKKIDTVDDLVQAIRQAQVGQKVEIIYWRGTTKSTASATLTERPQ